MNKIALTVSLLLILPSVHATVINVPGSQPTIQAGLNAANHGDTVLVADGVYTGDGNRDISFGGRNIILLSENGPEATIIDCEANSINPHVGFLINEGEDTTAIIDGFTVTNAYSSSYFDAALECDEASPKIRNCIVRDNVGNGVRFHRAELKMYDCIISHNTGYGLWLDETPATILGCKILYSGGNGVFWHPQWYGYHFEMADCLARGNHGTGVYLMVGSGTFHVQNCTFVGNITGISYDWDFPKVAAPAISAAVDTSAIEDCISAFNMDYGIVSHIWAGNVVVRCNDGYGNGIEDFHEVGVGPGDSYGNISENPLFCDFAVDDFSLSGNSPCLPENNECGVLMGAFGAGCNCCELRGDTDDNGQVDILDVDNFIDWFYRGGVEPDCLEEADVDGDDQFDILDIDSLINYLFRGGPPPVPCP